MEIKAGLFENGSISDLGVLIQDLKPEDAEALAYRAAREFISSLDKNKVNMDSVKILSELGFHDDPEISRRTLEPLFGVVINDLKKSFSKQEGDVYLEIFPHLIMKAREKSLVVDRWFEKMKISKENPFEDIYQRNKKIREDKKFLSVEDRDKIKKVILLSRNTIGAEAYLNGMIINRLLSRLKNAEIVFVDSSNTGKHIFNNSRIKLVNKFTDSHGREVSLNWNRNGINILERFEYTTQLAEFIELESKGLGNGEFIVFDADTRLSQTGAMPICSEDVHYFIDTVLEDEEVDLGFVKNFGALCNDYLNSLFNEEEVSYPMIFVSEEEKKKARDFRGGLPEGRVVLLHFGSGIVRKTLSGEFERELLLKVFDYGIPLIVMPVLGWEKEKVKEHILFLERKGKKQGEDFFVFQGSLSTFVALISMVDLCVSYDSQCQHMAAAQNVPFITLFTGYINKNFLKRWTPFSENFYKIIDLDKNEGDYEGGEFRKSLDSFALSEFVSALNEFERFSE
jgi:hypothetical protein